MSNEESGNQATQSGGNAPEDNLPPPTQSEAAGTPPDPNAEKLSAWAQWAQHKLGAQSPAARIAYEAAMNALEAGQDEKAAAQAGALAVFQARWALWAREKFGAQSPAARIAYEAAMNALKAGQGGKAAAQAGALVVLQLRWTQWAQQKFGVQSPAARIAFEAAMNALKAGQDEKAAAQAAEAAVKSSGTKAMRENQPGPIQPAGQDTKVTAQAGVLAVVQARWEQWAKQKFGDNPLGIRAATEAALRALKSGENSQAAAQSAEAAVEALRTKSLRENQPGDFQQRNQERVPVAYRLFAAVFGWPKWLEPKKNKSENGP